jgi:dihydrolipoamide dehydrogenase
LSKQFDIVILGGGPAGYPAAIRAAQLGASVCLVEKDRLGGVCLNWGCIPTKTLHGLAHLVELTRTGAGSGVVGSINVDPEEMLAHKERVVGDLVKGVRQILKGRKVDIVEGAGRIVSPGVIDVEGHGSIKGGSILVATGSSEISLPGMEYDGERILSSTDLLDLGRIPESMIVVGGGAIGCEFASIFNAFGTKVTIVEMLPSIIATEDTHVIRFLQSFMRKKGIDFHLGAKVESLEKNQSGITAVLDNGKSVEAELALVSVGRRPNVNGIGLEDVGVEVENGGIKVDSRMKTSTDGIYAAGDVIGGWLLAHVATREGIVAAGNMLGSGGEIDYGAVPATIYTLPEVASVGMTEDEAGKNGIEIATGRFPFAANGKAKGLREEEGFVKWVSSKSDGKLLGLHIIGPQATELLAAGIMAVGEGMTADRFASVIFPHPTLSEALGEAAEATEGKAIHLLR